jgi:hypothetical protein
MCALCIVQRKCQLAANWLEIDYSIDAVGFLAKCKVSVSPSSQTLNTLGT